MNPISGRRKSKTKLMVTIRIRSEAPVSGRRRCGAGHKAEGSQSVSPKAVPAWRGRGPAAATGERSAGYPLVLT